MGSRQSEDTEFQNHSPNPAINSHSIRLRITSKGGRAELLRARGDEAQSIANALDHVFISAQFHPAEGILIGPSDFERLCSPGNGTEQVFGHFAEAMRRLLSPA
jgi:hypothetical protein